MIIKTEDRIKPEKTRAQRPFREYSKDYKPMGQYALYAALYIGAVTAGLIATERKRKLPERLSPEDLLLLGVATHKMTRLVAKDWVTSPFRAPFTEFEEADGAGEVSESPRGKGMRQATGALIKRHQFEERSKLGTWLIGILKLKILDHFRAQKRTPTALATANVNAEEWGGDLLEHLFDKRGSWINPNYQMETFTESPLATAERAEIFGAINRCIGRTASASSTALHPP